MRPKSLKDLLKEDLTKRQLSVVPRSFDIVGDILIFSDFPKILEKKEKLIGSKILQNFENVKVILKKTQKYSGKFRTPKLKIIAGERRKNTEHRENNIRLKLDVEKVYFSPRSSNERLRINNLVKPKEIVLVMFSGCAPYPCNIAKNTKAKEIYGVEINPKAHAYGLENVKINKIKNVILLNQDIQKTVFDNKFDRIIMPLPKGAENFLSNAIDYSTLNTIIHFYTFCDIRESEVTAFKIMKACEKKGKRCKILRTVKCGHHSPFTNRVCIDIKML